MLKSICCRAVLCAAFLLVPLTVFPQSSDPVCSAEIGFTNPRTSVQFGSIVLLNLFSTVSNPSGCLPAQIAISATYYDQRDNFICSGIITSFVEQSNYVLSTNLEFRPSNILEFVRLIVPQRPAAKRLFCNNIEGNVEVGPSEVTKATSIAIRATILPKFAGVRTTEVRMTIVQ